jgi:cellobiose dehydrogenase (acceptor)
MKPFLESLGLLEINPLVDVDAKYDTFGRDVFAASGGQRGGPLVGYLPDAQRLSHFTLKLNSKVTRVVRTDEDIKGVEVNGTRLTAKAVVLSAGVWNTVALLFASGIGPLYELKRAAQLGFNIYPESEWIINNAVGANLHDNPSTTISLTWHDKDSVPAYDWTGAFVGKLVEADADLLFKNRTGPLTGFGRVLSGWMKVIHPEKDDISMVFQITCSTPAIQNGSFNCQFTLNEGALSRGQVSLGADGNLTFRDGSGPWLTDSERHDVSVYAIALKRFVDGASTFPGLSITSPPAGLSLAEYELYLGLNANRSNNRKSAHPTSHSRGKTLQLMQRTPFQIGAALALLASVMARPGAQIVPILMLWSLEHEICLLWMAL